MSNKPTKIVIQANPPKLSETDLGLTVESKGEYLSQLEKLQLRLKIVQQAYYHQKRRAMLVFEGWDAGGKGGTIRRITQNLDPRGFRVYPVSAPLRHEQNRHYLYRFYRKIPHPGTLIILDRSYYGRVLVERVEGFAKTQEWQRAYQEINEFERLLFDDGVRVAKFFMHISPEEQLQRFEERLNNPLKRWKLTEEDIRNREKWSDYENAINDMFSKTSTEIAPWNVVSGNHKWFARLNVLQIVVEKLEKGVNLEPPAVNKELIKSAESELGIVFREK